MVLMIGVFVLDLLSLSPLPFVPYLVGAGAVGFVLEGGLLLLLLLLLMMVVSVVVVFVFAVELGVVVVFAVVRR